METKVEKSVEVLRATRTGMSSAVERAISGLISASGQAMVDTILESITTEDGLTVCVLNHRAAVNRAAWDLRAAVAEMVEMPVARG